MGDSCSLQFLALAMLLLSPGFGKDVFGPTIPAAADEFSFSASSVDSNNTLTILSSTWSSTDSGEGPPVFCNIAVTLISETCGLLEKL